MNYLLDNAYKIFALFFVLLALSLAGCGTENSFSTTGSGSDINFVDVDAQEDAENISIDASKPVDNSVTNPAPVAE